MTLNVKYLQFISQRLNALTAPVSFVLDVTDGTRYNSAFFRDLALPVLGQAVGRDETAVIPIPDTHMVGGHAVLGDFFRVPHDLEGFARGEFTSVRIGMYNSQTRTLFAGMSARFNTTNDVMEWDTKEATIVYRATCSLTFSHDRHGTIFPRRDICGELHDSAFANISVTGPQCPLCNKGVRLPPEAMMKFRYQLVVEGYSASYDSSYWKMKSNSTCFWYIIGGADHTAPYWQLWWFAKLRPNIEYIPVYNGSISSAYRNCESSSRSLCRSVAMAAHRYVSNHVTPQRSADYVESLLKHLVRE